MIPDSPIQGALDPTQQAAIDAADASIAVLDAAGLIVAVNRGWLAFGEANGWPDAGSDVGRPYPFRGHDGVHGVIAGRTKSYSVIYPCHSPSERRWFRLLLVPVSRRDPTRVLVIHRRLAEAPTEREIAPAGEELARRWNGLHTMCAWCGARVRDVLGAWNPGRAEPGVVYSHGMCPTCLDAVLPANPAPRTRSVRHPAQPQA